MNKEILKIAIKNAVKEVLQEKGRVRNANDDLKEKVKQRLINSGVNANDDLKEKVKQRLINSGVNLTDAQNAVDAFYDKAVSRGYSNVKSIAEACYSWYAK